MASSAAVICLSFVVCLNRNRQEDVAWCRELLGGEKASEAGEPEGSKIPECEESITPARVCPCCGAGRMVVIAEFGPEAAGVEIAVRLKECVVVDSS